MKTIDIVVPLYDDGSVVEIEFGGTPYGGSEFTTYIALRESALNSFSDGQEVKYHKAQLVIDDSGTLSFTPEKEESEEEGDNN